MSRKRQSETAAPQPPPRPRGGNLPLFRTDARKRPRPTRPDLLQRDIPAEEAIGGEAIGDEELGMIGKEAPDATRDEEEDEGEDEAGEAPNFLAVYFRQMSQIAVLRPKEEFAIAHRIGALEGSLWSQLLSFAPMTHALLRVVERALDNSLPEFSVLRAAAAAVLGASPGPGQKDAGSALQAAAAATAVKLRKLDPDRVYVSLLLEEVRHMDRTGVGRVAEAAPDTSDQGWRAFVSRIEATARQVQEAKHDFVRANLRLVVSIARRYNQGRMPLSDLIQEGNLGLIKAVERFDYRRGYRFSTYASWWIRHAIARGLADKARAVRVPVHMLELYQRVAKQRRVLYAELGRQPTPAELGAATGLGEDKLEKLRGGLTDPLSLDREVSDADGRRFIDFMQDESAGAYPAEQLMNAAVAGQVRRVLSELKPLEAQILRQRFGLEGDKEMTLKEIGERHNLSRERIRQVQEQALLKMRRALQRTEVM
jgi:RNA polymerase primary sigma factor